MKAGWRIVLHVNDLIVLFVTGIERLKDREYLGTVNHICLNADYAAVGFEGKVQLHMVRPKCQSANMETLYKMFYN